ncbi:MAG: gamma-glutamyltransferase family protein [Marinosulfonomonas sp.]|nr:gamma-glutamyltransferase family protein [Marinosulfonomonas sp.]
MRDFHLPGRSAVFATNGMCATSHPLAARTAVRILEDGGNAVDAAIAAAALLGICEPHMTGLGGDCFVLLKPAGSEDIIALNGSGRAPMALRAADMRAKGHLAVPLGGPEAVTIPGAVDAFCRLSADWGKIGLAASLAPAIQYAQEGVPVAPRTAFDWSINQATLQGASRDFFLLNGKPPAVGQIFRHPRQADLLKKIAQQGRAAFYEGEVAEDMVSSLNAFGGCHTLDDFAHCSSNYTDPISGTYKGTELVEHPPNGQGATAILLANILAQFDLAAMDPFGAQRTHIEAEATKLAYDARDRFVADADYTARLDHMVAPETATALAGLIDPKSVMSISQHMAGSAHKDTVYISVVDKDRMAVSLIYSIFKAFGSGLCSSKYGVLFHNRGTGFTLEDGHPNEAAGGKRPMHTIIPSMLRKGGKVTMPFGVMGGAYQANGHVRFLTNMVDFELNPQNAIDAPRSFAEGNTLNIERGYRDNVVQDLVDLGHQVAVPNAPIGGAQAILIDNKNGVLLGASDARKDGAAIGY